MDKVAKLAVQTIIIYFGIFGCTSLYIPKQTSNEINSPFEIEAIISQLPMQKNFNEFQKKHHQQQRDCSSLSPDLVKEIDSYSEILQNISNLVFNGPFNGKTYNFLAEFVDKFGPRLTGSESLENAIDYMVESLKDSGLDSVHAENVTVPIWTRGTESLLMIRPRMQQMAMLGLGTSIGTSSEGITAEIVVARSFDELNNKSSQVSGKIVVFNQPFVSYDITADYRVSGAVAAASYGAVAVLVRSVTPASIYSPHTGLSEYAENMTKIPAACITIEDAEMLQRITDRGETVIVTLKMEAQNHGDGISRNTVAELTGRSNPKEVVIISGHLDSWDVGQGAMDDGGGAIISIFANLVLQNLTLKPRRTIRTVLWTGEEFAYVGAKSYRNEHKNELDDLNIVMESDLGTFNPKGLSFSGTDDATCILEKILDVAASLLNTTTLITPDNGSDTGQFSSLGIPTASLLTNSPTYFNYHHSNGDTMTVENSDELDRCLVFWAFTSYVLADLSIRLPRNETTMHFVN